MAKTQREESAERLAGQILSLAHNTLTVHLRFADRALNAMTPLPDDTLWFAGDGKHLHYEPWYVLGQYKAEPTRIQRDLLHTVLHCVFRHSAVGKTIEREKWDLACDMAVENVIGSLELPCLYAGRQEEQTQLLSALEQELGTLSAERIYAWLKEKAFSGDELKQRRMSFLGDSHALWYASGNRRADGAEDEELEQRWQAIARRMQSELENFCGEGDSALVQNLRLLRRKSGSYRAFLRRFGEYGETMRISEEEFDYNYYTYGLSVYGNMPLIEPLEYRQQKRLRTFVIAIDTSGSVKGEVVQAFMQRTCEILLKQENLFTKVNIHILQCDDRIREDVCLHCREDFERYLEGLTIRGLGETDFRPVFSHVSELLRQGKLPGLRGLLYFTDGEGIYPAEKPAFDTAFVIHRNDFRQIHAPVWAMQMTLQEEDILDRDYDAE